MVRAGASLMIEDSELDGAVLAKSIASIAADPERARTMGDAARTMATPGAAKRAAELLSLCAGSIDSARKPPEQ
jgi:UDP-N-acetylglucosamine:LPS N-acetylglucosamine transferase